MIKYSGNIVPNDEQKDKLNDIISHLAFLEQVYSANINISTDKNKPISIQDEDGIEKINNIQTSNETKDNKDLLIEKVMRESGSLNENYQKKLFNALLLDFNLWMEESLRMLQEFKPQLAFALSRKPLIDGIYYLQLLYLDPQSAVDTVFLDNAKDKEILKEKDKEMSEKICAEFGLNKCSFYDLRYDESIGILSISNSALHIVTSRKNKKTRSGELNFVFLKDDIIEKYTQIYLNIISVLMDYVVELILKIEFKLYNVANESQIYKSLLAEIIKFTKN